MLKGTLVGNLGGDPDTRYTQSGQMVVNFSVASNRKGPDGEKITTWVRVACWGKLAELMDQFAANGWLVKGKQVVVLGNLSLNTFQRQDGTDGASIEMNAQDVQLVGDTPQTDNGTAPAASPAPQRSAVPPQRQRQGSSPAQPVQRSRRPAAEAMDFGDVPAEFFQD